jgi:DeoR family transcriptional regulator, fructose operon transcriptional repressor
MDRGGISLLAIKRLEIISQLLSETGSVDATKLSERFAVTPKTIRKDLDKLESMGLLDRVHGGAILKRTDNSVFPIEQRKLKNLSEKQRIGAAALEYVNEGDSIIIDGGTTTLELARLLGEKKILAITSDLKITMELMNKPNVDLFVTGGRLRRQGAYTLLGRDAEKVLEKYKAKKVFLGTTALDLKNGLSVLNSDEAEVKKAMIAAAQEVICLVDHSKFHHVTFAPFCSIEDIDTLITDSRILPEEQEELERRGVRVRAV